MTKFKIISTLTLLLFISAPIFAGSEAPVPDTKKTTEASKNEVDIQQVISDYKTYLASIPAETRSEIVEFRKKNAELNKQKRELYRKLSKEAQDYLKEEQKYKRKLPMNQKKDVTLPSNIDNPA